MNSRGVWLVAAFAAYVRTGSIGIGAIFRKYEHKGKLVDYDKPRYEYKEMDIDGEFADEFANEIVSGFKLLGRERYKRTRSLQNPSFLQLSIEP